MLQLHATIWYRRYEDYMKCSLYAKAWRHQRKVNSPNAKQWNSIHSGFRMLVVRSVSGQTSFLLRKAPLTQLNKRQLLISIISARFIENKHNITWFNIIMTYTQNLCTVIWMAVWYGTNTRYLKELWSKRVQHTVEQYTFPRVRSVI